jgi:HlyD family secretion protein
VLAAGIGVVIAAFFLVYPPPDFRPDRIGRAQRSGSVLTRHGRARVLSKIGFEVAPRLSNSTPISDRGERPSARAPEHRRTGKAPAKAALDIAEVNIKKAEANLEKAQAVFAQKQEANRRKQALVGRDIVTQQSAEEALRDEVVARADVAVAVSETERRRTYARAQLQYEETMLRH